MQVLVIGYGSIGKRHAHILQSLGCQVVLVTAQQVTEFTCYASIIEALSNESIQYVIIANPTALHYEALLLLIQCDYRGVVLVEKPLFSFIEKLPDHHIAAILVAYNLRFHPLLIQARKIIENSKLITFSTYVGQYLPDWRKHTDYRHCYSAKKELGGGVLRDLSHELDYALWFCGPAQSIAATGGRLSELEINSDDVYAVLMTCVACPVVNIQVNYLERQPRREISMNTNKNTILVDLITGKLFVDGKLHNEVTDGIAQTYLTQHKALLRKQFDLFCSYGEGEAVMKLIGNIEEVAKTNEWI
ncbi:MAG: hypothetical protein A3E82_03110 [Gammaproteobacteria bacterium RIFCSPHIGHO2_12_FULL_38_11]|nr:MAG: hypothetical protein A3E82_03110 [Gammaproteobacteria bacterium RIFCSPHIGHO2_12_FULL_38_11]